MAMLLAGSLAGSAADTAQPEFSRLVVQRYHFLRSDLHRKAQSWQRGASSPLTPVAH
jgi:hypothetical protein